MDFQSVVRKLILHASLVDAAGIQPWSLLPKGWIEVRLRYWQRGEGRVGASNNGFVVDELLIGDFEVDESTFEIALLPIPKGTQVEDQRVEPPLMYEIEK